MAQPISPKGHWFGIMYNGDASGNTNTPVIRSEQARFRINNSLGFSRRDGSFQKAIIVPRFIPVMVRMISGTNIAAGMFT